MKFQKGHKLNEGKNHPNWKGGVTKEWNKYHKIYQSKAREQRAGRPKPEQCEVCGVFGKDLKLGLCYDHDHATGKFRGWICQRCNSALGMVKDNRELLIKLSEYLNKNL